MEILTNVDNIWEKLHSQRSWGSYPSDHLVSKVMRQFSTRNSREHSNALELGCGKGANLSFLLNEGFNVWGVDGSHSAIENAKIFLNHKGSKKLNLSVQTFDRMHFSIKFDLVIDYFALYANDFNTILETFKKVEKIIKPGGYFYSRFWGTETEFQKISGTI